MVVVVLFSVTFTIILLVPISAIELVTEEVIAFPTETILITDAIPIIIPSIVSIARILLDLSPAKANAIFSFINMILHHFQIF